MKDNPKLSEKSADDIFDKLLDHYDVDVSLIADESAKRGAIAAHNKIKDAIRKGKVEIEWDEDETPTIIQHLYKPVIESPVRYGEIDGRAKIAMKDCSETDNYGKIYALLGGVSKRGQAEIIKLKGRDLSIAECIGALFLQV